MEVTARHHAVITVLEDAWEVVTADALIVLVLAMATVIHHARLLAAAIVLVLVMSIAQAVKGGALVPVQETAKEDVIAALVGVLDAQQHAQGLAQVLAPEGVLDVQLRVLELAQIHVQDLVPDAVGRAQDLAQPVL